MHRLAEAVSTRLQRSWWRPEPDALARSLAPLSRLYATLLARRRAPVVERLPVPVIVIGNLIVGGAGKTPSVIAIVRCLRAAGWTPGVISRGYGRDSDALLAVTARTPALESGDEPLLIHLRTGAPVVVGHKRVAAARMLLQQAPNVNLIVSDDGLQHRALARDVQVVVFDERGIGNGLLLPAGPLREPMPATLPPNTLVLYNAAQPSTPLPGWTATRRLGGVTPLADWRHAAPSQPLDTLRGRPLVAAAGIAEPERFFRMLEAHGLTIQRCPLPDHHRFEQLPWRGDASDVILTEKDAVKLQPGRVGGARVWVAALDFEPPPAFDAALLAALASR